jgi:magnesium and cobalt transporter
VFALADRVPTRGDVLKHESGVRFEVLEADPRRVQLVRVRRGPGPERAGEAQDGAAG